MTGLGTALKILFSGDFDQDRGSDVSTSPSQGLPRHKPDLALSRNEVVALFNAFGKISTSNVQLEKFREMLRKRWLQFFWIFLGLLQGWPALLSVIHYYELIHKMRFSFWYCQLCAVPYQGMTRTSNCSISSPHDMTTFGCASWQIYPCIIENATSQRPQSPTSHNPRGCWML